MPINYTDESLAPEPPGWLQDVLAFDAHQQANFDAYYDRDNHMPLDESPADFELFRMIRREARKNEGDA